MACARLHSRLEERLQQHQRAGGRLLGRLQDHGVAAASPAAVIPVGMAAEVPGRDHHHHAARRVAHRVALAGHLEEARGPARARPPRGRSTRGSRSPRTRRRPPPRLGALADLEGGQLEPALAQPCRRPAEHLGALPAGALPHSALPQRPPPPRRQPRPVLPCRRSPPHATAPRDPWTRGLGLTSLAADQHRHARGQPRVEAPPARRPATGARAPGASRAWARWQRAAGSPAASSSSSSAPSRQRHEGRTRWRCSRAGGGPGTPSATRSPTGQ